MRNPILPLLLLIISVLLFLGACQKNDDAPSPVIPETPVVPVLQDSLASGWQKINFGDSIALIDVWFVNNQIGFICGGGYIGKSTDGGLTWKKCMTPAASSGTFNNLFFIDANNGWAVSLNFLLKTTDGGISWQKISNTFVDAMDVQFLSRDTGYVTDGKGLHKTTDGGTTWTKLVNNTTTGAAAGLYFLDEKNGWVTTSHNILKTTDGGASFTILFGHQDFQSRGYYIVHFTDLQHGWISGAASTRKTSDGGKSWELPLPPRDGIGDVHFFNADRGFVMSGNKIYTTMDGGKTLIKQVSLPSHTLVELHFSDPDHGWAVGTKGCVLKYVKP